MPEPPNPAPPPFSGPTPVTGSGRTAFMVPTFVGRGAKGAPRRRAAGGTLRGHHGDATMEAPAIGTDEDLTVPRGRGSVRGQTRRASADSIGAPPATVRGGGYDDQPGAGASPYAQTVQYDDNQQAEWDREAMDVASGRQPAAGRGPRPSGARPGSSSRGGGGGRPGARTAGGAPPKKKSNTAVIALSVIVLLGGVGAMAWLFLGPGAGGGNNNNAVANNGTPPLNIDNAGDPVVLNNADVNGANGSNGTGSTGPFKCEWLTPPPKFTSNPRFSHQLKVETPAALERITLNATDLPVPAGDSRSLTLDIDLDLSIEPTENFTLRLLSKAGHKGEFRFVVYYDADAPTVAFAQPVPTADPMTAVTTNPTVALVLRITDDVLLRKVVVRVGGQTYTDEFTDEEKKVTHSFEKDVRFNGDGRWPVEVEATDGAGTVKRWTGTIEVDSRPPSVEFGNQPVGTRRWSTGQEIESIRGVVRDPGGRPQRLTIGGFAQRLQPSGAESATFLWEPRLRPGENPFEVIVEDVAGNTDRFTIVIEFRPEAPPKIVQIDLDSDRRWSENDAPPRSFRYSGSSDSADLEVYFEALGRGTPTATVNGRAADVASSGGIWRMSATIDLSGEETAVTVEVRAGDRTSSVQFTITRTPFASPVMPLHRVDGIDVDRTFPPSGNVELDPERLAIDFAPDADGGVVVATAEQRLEAFSADGDERWTAQMPDGLRVDALRRVGDRLVVRTVVGELLVLDGNDGSLRQRLPARSAPGTALAMVDDSRLAVQQQDGTVNVVDVQTGEGLAFPAPGRPGGPLVSVGGRYLLLGRGGVSALHLTLRRPVWQSPVAATDVVATTDGMVYIAEVTGRIVALKGFATGTPAAEVTPFADGGRIVPLPGGGLLATGRSPDDPAVTRWIHWAENPLAGEGTQSDGPTVEALRVGPDGTVWCLVNGYVCRLAR